MRIRIVLTGIAAGLVCLSALWFPWYLQGPVSAVSDWGYAGEAAVLPVWIDTAVAVFCGLTLFVFGWVAARWNWARDWRESLLAGVNTGLLSGCLIYLFLGAFHFGLLGQEPVLRAYHNGISESQGLVILVDALSASALQMNAGLLALLIVCALASGLGGLASVIDAGDTWGRAPRHTDSWLPRATAYELALHGAVWMVVCIAVFQVLQEVVTETVVENELSGLTIYPIILPLFMLTMMVSILLPVGVTWGWILREWQNAGLWRIFYLFWLLLTVPFTGWLLYRLYEFTKVFTWALPTGMLLPIGWLGLPAILLSAVALGATSKPVSASELPHRAADWLGFALANGILGGTQIFVSAPAYVAAMMVVTVENTPHLTGSGMVESLPAEQVALMSNTLSLIAAICIALTFFGSLFTGLFILGVRKFLKIKPAAGILPDDGASYETHWQ